MSIFTSTFNWFKNALNLENPTKRDARRPKSVDWTDSLQINSELTKGLYHNSYPGMKLAGSMCYTPIAVPVWFMGLPIPKMKEENEDYQEILNSIVDLFAIKMQQLHTQIHRDGTLWIFPSYSTKENKLIWEFIEDDIICDIVRDINTREIIEVITDEEITVTTGYNTTAIVRRKRYFTKTKITIEYSATGSVPVELKSKSQRNILGILPIVFANNKDADSVRGHSDYERIVTDLKDYHDIDLKRSNMLAKFNVKMVQYTPDVAQWIKNSGYSSMNDIDVSTIDLIFNDMAIEKTDYIFPERAHEAYQSGLENKYLKIVEGSGIPEILWGGKVTGNMASADNQVDMVVKLVEDKRMQKNDSYKKLFEASLKLILLATMNQAAEKDHEIIIEWNALDAISEETKSIILKNFSDGIASLINAAGITKEQLYRLWVDVYPGATEDEKEDFVKGLDEMARHKQYREVPFELAGDLSGAEPIE